jgi:S-adenosylmethionine:tRNA ribosyltransferase-isomerase
MTDDDQRSASYQFDLPARLIAQQPAEQRDESRLMVLSGTTVEHRIFRDLPQILRAGDLLVLNETRVIAARLYGTAEKRRVEILLLRPADRSRYDPSSLRWLALAKPGKKLRTGALVEFSAGGRRLARAEVAAVHADDGVRELAFTLDVPFEELLERAGRLPLPPYIHNDSPEAQARYQTVFARNPGSVAALLRDHLMHDETYVLPAATIEAIARTKRDGRRVVAVGTTVVRALEGNALDNGGELTAGAARTNCFITPGFRFRIVDAMITNFHLPQSTLLVLVSAFAGRERILEAYRQAVAREYRFFSFGDAILLEPSE